MIWGVIVLLSLLGVLLIVIIVALLKYLQLYRIQQGIEKAWFANIVCAGRTETDACKLHYRNDLGPPPTSDVFGPEFDQGMARLMADYVARAEFAEEEEDTVPLPPEHIEVAVYRPQSGPIFGVAYMYGPTMILAFRATVTTDEIQEDLNAWQVRYDDGTEVKNPFPAANAPNLISGDEAYVHAGFYKVFSRYREEILETVGTYKPSYILLSGHSLGGAVASLVAMDLSERVLTDNRVSGVKAIVGYVFGTPRIGNATLNTRLQAAPGLTALWRVVNLADNIQDLPFYVMPNFKYPSKYQAFYYTHAGSKMCYLDNQGSWQANHRLANYISFLD